MSELTGLLSMRPDSHMRWIYDSLHKDYNTPRAKDLRERRERAIANAPEYLREIARMNDTMREQKT